MKRNYLDKKTRMIRENFNDTRIIKCQKSASELNLDEDITLEGDIFKTEDGELIYFEVEINDFDEEELTKYIELAECLYEKHHEKISIYLLCPKDINVLVRECPIKSEADFTIKLACSQDDICHMILKNIKNKIKNGIHLTCDDHDILEELPVRCNKKDRHYFRVETLKIINGHFP